MGELFEEDVQLEANDTYVQRTGEEGGGGRAQHGDNGRIERRVLDSGRVRIGQ